jgi:hypothetical protein
MTTVTLKKMSAQEVQWLVRQSCAPLSEIKAKLPNGKVVNREQLMELAFTGQLDGILELPTGTAKDVVSYRSYIKTEGDKTMTLLVFGDGATLLWAMQKSINPWVPLSKDYIHFLATQLIELSKTKEQIHHYKTKTTGRPVTITFSAEQCVLSYKFGADGSERWIQTIHDLLLSYKEGL